VAGIDCGCRHAEDVTTHTISAEDCWCCCQLKVKVNFEIYIAERKATTCIKAELFLLRCVYPAALPLIRCYSIRHPWRVASWVYYSSRRTDSSSEHFASDPRLLKTDAPWCENKRCSDSNPWPMDPKASVLLTTRQRPHTVTSHRGADLNNIPIPVTQGEVISLKWSIQLPKMILKSQIETAFLEKRNPNGGRWIIYSFRIVMYKSFCQR